VRSVFQYNFEVYFKFDETINVPSHPPEVENKQPHPSKHGKNIIH
jgi:hypothetical protein